MGMGAEEENGEANQRSGPNPTPNPLTQAQFLSWKRHKVKTKVARVKESSIWKIPYKMEDKYAPGHFKAKNKNDIGGC
ncbi:uncharacterized protein LOC131329532 isoform X3 [Rhododendron vialii]|uniref:uncharacterized protein LOC131329532 isoform X3 n=1 Tax=Rhododendron vialii TaxID=182163 RepID=UPI00265F343A|nr:uncharacterized protein LOC131329532 isoform X3 [Rhododendron vialii]